MFLLISALGLALQVVTAEPPGPNIDPPPERFLATLRVLAAQESQGEVTFLDPEGATRTLREGERLVEEDAVLKEVTRGTLVFTKRVTGGDGTPGESLIVVRFDGSGKVKVREYATVVQDEAPKKPPRTP
jgi:uncharacterized protein (AIM24 family)